MLNKPQGGRFTAAISFNHSGKGGVVKVGFVLLRPGTRTQWGSRDYGAYQNITIPDESITHQYQVTLAGQPILTSEPDSDVDLLAYVHAPATAQNVLEYTERAHIGAGVVPGDGEEPLPLPSNPLPTNNVVNVVCLECKDARFPKGIDAARYATTVDLYRMQAWVRDQLGGRTFELGSVIGYRSPKTLAQLQSGSDCTDINYCGEGFCQSQIWHELGDVGISNNVTGQVLGVIVAGGGGLNFGSPWPGGASGAFLLTWWRLYSQLSGSPAPCCAGGNLGRYNCEGDGGWLGTVMPEAVLGAIAGVSFHDVHVGDPLSSQQKNALLSSKFIREGVNIQAAFAPYEFCINLIAIEPFDRPFPVGLKEATYVGMLLLNETREWISAQLGGPTFRLGTFDYYPVPYSLASLQPSPPKWLDNIKQWSPNECGEGMDQNIPGRPENKTWDRLIAPIAKVGQITGVILSGGGGQGFGLPLGPDDPWHPNSGLYCVGDWTVSGALQESCSACIQNSVNAGIAACDCRAQDCWIRQTLSHEILHTLGVHHRPGNPEVGIFPYRTNLTDSEKQILLASPYIRNW